MNQFDLKSTINFVLFTFFVRLRPIKSTLRQPLVYIYICPFLIEELRLLFFFFNDVAAFVSFVLELVLEAMTNKVLDLKEECPGR